LENAFRQGRCARRPPGKSRVAPLARRTSVPFATATIGAPALPS
jgi:hypothetical protein